ncbi:O-antigen ligase family protein [Pseudonocardia acaciae]|uniref:O-antigen ligase family protein n=1 Tax=Pseudonocardia acaciae TaxID=551276 RepID=UPI000ACF0064|nr:O-antigen ligase family protein [Pseudonocardia acaciae]
MTITVVGLPRTTALDPARVVLGVLACAVVGLAPVDGYLHLVHPQLAKLPAVLLLVGWAAVRLARRQAPRAHPVHAPLAVLGAVLLASSAVHLTGPYTVGYLQRWVPFLVVTVVLMDVAAREVPLRYLLASAATGAAAAGLGALYSVVVAGDTRASGPLDDPNDLAYVLVAALPLALVLAARRATRLRWRLLALAGAGVMVVGAAGTLSRGGALALVAVAVCLGARRVLSRRVLAGAVGLVAAAVAVIALALPQELSLALDEKRHVAAENVDSRTLRWQAAARMLATDPVLGVGPGGFRERYAASSHRAELMEQTPVAHDMYLEVGAELGWPGLAAFLGVIAVALLAAEDAIRRGDADERLLAVGVQAGLVAVAVASVFLSEQYYLPLWSLVAMACAAQPLTRRRAR